ncbi:hypothetical protein J6590_065079, partial [Homalodisca vitripennis]
MPRVPECNDEGLNKGKSECLHNTKIQLADRIFGLFVTSTNQIVFGPCSYDVLELLEPGMEPRRICGDWSDKLKLLRYVTSSPRLVLRFVSDYSHHFGGFKSRVAMEHAPDQTTVQLAIVTIVLACGSTDIRVPYNSAPDVILK